MLWETLVCFTTFHLSSIGMIFFFKLWMPVSFKHHFIITIDDDKVILE